MTMDRCGMAVIIRAGVPGDKQGWIADWGASLIKLVRGTRRQTTDDRRQTTDVYAQPIGAGEGGLAPFCAARGRRVLRARLVLVLPLLAAIPTPLRFGGQVTGPRRSQDA